MQSITIAGRLGRDAELRQTNNGDSVCGFTVAVDVRQGREKVTNWWRVSLWGKRGEALAQYLTKGASVTVVGEFSLGEYDGKPQLNIRASEIALQGGGGDNRQSDNGQRRERQSNDDRSDRRSNGNGGGGGGWGSGNGGGGGGGWGSGNGGGGGRNHDDLDDDIPFATNDSIW